MPFSSTYDDGWRVLLISEAFIQSESFYVSKVRILYHERYFRNKLMRIDTSPRGVLCSFFLIMACNQHNRPVKIGISRYVNVLNGPKWQEMHI